MPTRIRCYDCFRPQQACFCAAIPSIENRTEVLILQHRRERFHPFNTARILHKSLRHSQLLVGHIGELAAQMCLKPRAGLLLPGAAARRVADLPTDEHPEQLVVLDGTWHHAKTLFREIPALHRLPRYQLAPPSPSRYRIRRPPNESALSTVEAAVAALQIIEPETRGFDQLLKAFDTMVEGQLAHVGSTRVSRFPKRRNRTWKNIPVALLGDLRNIVVAYGEAAEGHRGSKRLAGPPILWMAQRLSGGECFSCLLHPPGPLTDTFLGHLELRRSDFDNAVSPEAARTRWAEFRRPGDIVTVLQPGTARLFSFITDRHEPCLVLKSVDMDSNFCESTRDESSTAVAIQHIPAQPSRATKRLAKAIALVHHLNALANHQLTASGNQAIRSYDFT